MKIVARLLVIALLAGILAACSPLSGGTMTPQPSTTTPSATASPVSPTVSPVPPTSGPVPQDIRDRVGVVHAGGKYAFTDEPFLTEGAKLIRNEVGSRSIKLWLSSQYAGVYPFHHEWEAYASMTELISTKAYKDVLDMDFMTIDLVAHGLVPTTFIDGLDAEERVKVEAEMHDLALYLFETYQNSGKTFILQNWEGDNMLGQDAVPEAVQGFTDWVNARQDGILRARKEAVDKGLDGVRVYGALELNKVSSGWIGPKLLDDVLPNTYCDLYSYSNWETGDDDLLLKDNLDRIAAKAPDSKDFGAQNVYLGELGGGEMLIGGDKAQLANARTQIETALDWGCPFAFYWEIYCNERKRGDLEVRPVSVDMAGFWLIRPDGTASSTFWFLKGLLSNQDLLSAKPTASPWPIPTLPPEPTPIVIDEKKVVFDDDLIDWSKTKAHSDILIIDRIKPEHEEIFKPYGGDFTMAVRAKAGDAFIQYSVAAPNLVVWFYIYDSEPKLHLKIQGSSDGKTWKDLKSFYTEKRSTAWGASTASLRLDDGIKSVRVVFLNLSSPNAWDPLVHRVAFLKD
jgi:hypothetical protein